MMQATGTIFWRLQKPPFQMSKTCHSHTPILFCFHLLTIFGHARSEEPVAEPAQTNHAKPNEHSTDHFPQDTDSSLETVQAQSLSHVEALKHSDEVDPARSSTPEIIKTITEVSESAALLDRSTPEPEVPETTADRIEEYSSTTLMSNAAGTAAEVADSAALLDHPTPEPEAEALGKSKEASSEVAAEVADTAATLDTEVVGEAPSEVAAQVADTAAKLDTVEVSNFFVH